MTAYARGELVIRRAMMCVLCPANTGPLPPLRRLMEAVGCKVADRLGRPCVELRTCRRCRDARSYLRRLLLAEGECPAALWPADEGLPQVGQAVGVAR